MSRKSNALAAYLSRKNFALMNPRPTTSVASDEREWIPFLSVRETG